MAIVLFRILSAVFTIIYFLLIAHIILSWIRTMNPTLSQLAEIVDQLVEPILRPIRNVVPSVDLGGIRLDLSVIVALILVNIIQSVVLPLVLALA